MSFITKVLQEPTYGWADKRGNLIKPSVKRLYAEALKNINVFKSKKNWMPFFSWSITILLLPFLVLFGLKFISLPFFLIAFAYGMIVTSVHGTIWYHRFCTHKAFSFSHPIWRIITKNLVIKTVPEEVYVISHHVHHAISDEPGDPYNARGGFMYCMLADVNHQSIAKDLSEEEYNKAKAFMAHTGAKLNTYKQYQKWGTVTNPYYALITHFVNWAFWFGIFYLIGGFPLAFGLFTASLFWFIIVRAFNYTGHGNGKEAHKDGIDYDRSNLSINQTRPGYFSGEWHNNHHLYPNSARAGFLPYQLDLAWVYIYVLHKIGAVKSFRDNKKDFLKKYGVGK